MSAEVLERIAARHARVAPTLGGGPAWARRRSRALAALQARGLPDRRDENWRYLDHARLAGYRFEAEPAAAARDAELAPRLLAVSGARRVVLVDGRYVPALSHAAAGDGVEVADLAALVQREPEAALSLLREPGEDADDRYALLADAFAASGVVLRVAAGSAPTRPLYLVHVATAAAEATHHARVVVDVGAGASLTLVEHFVALGGAAALGNLAAEVTVGPRGKLAHLRLHEHGPAAAQVETWVGRLGESADYEQHLIAAGGRLVRSDVRLELAGKAAACRLTGLFAADAERQVDLRTLICHRGEATSTRQDYRGLASGRGRGAFNGRIVVLGEARGADASQSSRNLLLSPLAEIDTRPQLEIHVDEVQCQHGATVGSLDEDQLFYLRSRGLDEATARQALVLAFCEDVIRRAPLPALQDAARRLVSGTLEGGAR